MNRSGPTVRIARWSATHPWRAIGLWVVFVIACVAVGGTVGAKDISDAQSSSTEAARADQITQRGAFADPETETILITARGGRLDAAAAERAAKDAAARARSVPGVIGVDDPASSADGRAMAVRVELRDDDAVGDNVTTLLAATADVQRAHPDLRIEQAGGESLDMALSDTLGSDFRRAELFSIPLTLVILLVAFGALIAASVPLLLALSAVAAAIGLSALTSHLVPADESLNSIILLIGLAVGVDYSLFYVRREREERAAGRSHTDAVEIAAATSGHAIVVSGIAVIVSMSGLFFAGEATFSSMAMGSILVVAVAMIGSLTVLPGLLAKLGRWVDRPRVPVLWRLSAQRGGTPRLWPALLRPVLRRPALTFAASVLALGALTVPALGMNLQMDTIDDLPRSIPVMQTYDRLTTAFPSTGTTHVVAVEAPAERAGDVRRALDDLAARTADSSLFAHDREPEIRTSADGLVSVLSVGVPFEASDDRAAEGVAVLRTTLVPQTVGAVKGTTYAVGGEVAWMGDFTDTTRDAIPVVVGFVLALTFLVMLATFRSPVIAVTAIALNVLSAGASFGLLTLVFQNSWAEGLLGFESNGGIVTWLPLMLFVILFGLSMDYHVFVVSRIREAARSGLTTKAAVERGITTSAGVVTSAALVMVGVFSIFATLTTLDMKQLGVGLAAAILIDATIIRAVVLPSAMTLLGRWNWWTPRLLAGGRGGPPASLVVPAQGAARAPERETSDALV